MDLRRVTIQQQVLNTDMDELINTRPGLEQRLDHQTVLAAVAVCGLDQAFDFASIQPIYRTSPPSRGLQLQPSANLLDNIFRLIVSEVMLAPEAYGFLNGFRQRLRDRFLTTRFAVY
jgi:hypothetical protein